MTIWVDGDSVPRDLRPMLVRKDRGEGEGGEALRVRFVASRKLPDVPAGLLRLVAPGQDAADAEIEASAQPGDLVITRDIPFAERMVRASIPAMNDRGDIFTADSVAERRSLRDAAAELRLLGIAERSPSGNSRTARDVKRFADALDKLLASIKRGKGTTGQS